MILVKIFMRINNSRSNKHKSGAQTDRDCKKSLFYYKFIIDSKKFSKSRTRNHNNGIYPTSVNKHVK